MEVSGGDEFDDICIKEVGCRQVVGQVIDVGDKQYRAFDRALRDTTYGLSYLGSGSIDVHLKLSSAEETFICSVISCFGQFQSVAPSNLYLASIKECAQIIKVVTFGNAAVN